MISRLFNIIKQDKEIWDLSDEEAENILIHGIANKIYFREKLRTEDDFIEAWLESLSGFLNIDNKNEYIGIDRDLSKYIWYKNNPHSFIRRQSYET